LEISSFIDILLFGEEFNGSQVWNLLR